MAKTYALPHDRPLNVALVEVVEPVDEPPR
jgi:hypothetical protein